MRSLQLIAVFALALAFCSGSILLRKTVTKEGYACDVEDNGKLFPSKENCNAYYECYHQKVLIRYCDVNERYDAYKEKCVYDQGCNPGGYSSDDTHAPEGYANEGYANEGYGPVETKPVGYVDTEPAGYVEPHAPKGKPAPKDVHYNPCLYKDFIPISHVCFAYFKCINYEAVYQECPKGKRFDAEYGYCVPDESCYSACPAHIEPNPHNDKSFLLGGKKIPCPYGTFFDYRICTCDHYYAPY